MAFKRLDKGKSGISLPSLIDIIFLLLIFSLVTFSILSEDGDGPPDPTHPIDSLELPLSNTKDNAGAKIKLETLMFQIEYQDNENKDINKDKIIYALFPAEDDTLTIGEAIVQSKATASFAILPEGYATWNNRMFNDLEAVSLINNAIEMQQERNAYTSQTTNFIELRFVRDTEFRIINHILTECKNADIPNVVVRTLTGEG